MPAIAARQNSPALWRTAGLLLGWATAACLAADDARGPLRAAIDDLAATFGTQYPRAAEFQTRLNALAADSGAPFEDLRREALLANPLLVRQPVLFVARHQFAPDHHNTETFFQNGEINTGSFRPGGALRLLDLASGKATTLLEAGPDGLLRDPEVSFDGKRILFSWRRTRGEESHLYVINADGSGLRPLTSAAGVNDIDPAWLPDGGIVFTSTREPKYCMCNRHIMGNLFRMDGDGANIHQIGRSTLHEGHPSVMPDGASSMTAGNMSTATSATPKRCGRSTRMAPPTPSTGVATSLRPAP